MSQLERTSTPDGGSMELEDNKALARRANEMWAGNNTDDPAEIFAPGYSNHQEPDISGGVSARSLEDWKALLTGHRKAFPDCRTRVLTQIAEGDLVATRWEFTGTHKGRYMGLEPSGRTATWTGIQIDRIQNGKIVESWVDWDKYRQFQALGLVD